MKLKRRIPLCATAGALLAINQAYKVYKDNKAAGAGAMWKSMIANMTGYNVTTKTWSALDMGITLPLAVGCGVSYAGSRFKMNRYLPKPLAW